MPRAASLILAFCLLGFGAGLLRWLGLGEALTLHVGKLSDILLSPAEHKLTAALIGIGLPAVLLLAMGLPERVPTAAAALTRRLGFAVPVLVGVAATLLLRHFVMRGAWFIEDEQAYFFQAAALGSGRLAFDLPPEWALLEHPFLVLLPDLGSGPRWTGPYPWLQPALLLLSQRVGIPGLSQTICAGLIILHGGKLAETLADRPTGLLAAWLLATSPMLLGLSATYHTAVPACLLSILAVRAAIAMADAPTVLRGLALGAAGAGLLHTRPFEAFLLGTCIGLWWLTRWRAPRWSQATLGALLTGGLGIAMLALLNKATTGSIALSPYGLLEAKIGPFFGFGQEMMWGRPNTPALGLLRTVSSLLRVDLWMFGLPGSLAALIGIGIASPARRVVAWLTGLAMFQLLAYFPFAFGSVHDFGSAYHLWMLPWLAIGLATGISAMPWLRQRAAAGAIGAIVASLVLFWPVQIERWLIIADLILAPVEAAAEIAQDGPIVVLYTSMRAEPRRTWVRSGPVPLPDAPVWWVRETPVSTDLAPQVFDDRRIFRLRFDGDRPVLTEVRGQP